MGVSCGFCYKINFSLPTKNTFQFYLLKSYCILFHLVHNTVRWIGCICILVSHRRVRKEIRCVLFLRIELLWSVVVWVWCDGFVRGTAAAQRRGRQSVERTQPQRHPVDHVDQSADSGGSTAERQARARRRIPRESPAYNGAQRLSSSHSLTRHHTADSFQPPHHSTNSSFIGIFLSLSIWNCETIYSGLHTLTFC